jgi:hypothetical protein
LSVMIRFGLMPASATGVESPPQPVLLAGNAEHHLVGMPDIGLVRRLALQASSVFRPRLHAPETDGFLRNRDATFEQQFPDQQQAEREAKGQPDGVNADLWRITSAFADDRLAHDPAQ